MSVIRLLLLPVRVVLGLLRFVWVLLRPTGTDGGYASKGNFRPVVAKGKLRSGVLPVRGSLQGFPAGVFSRNGPNPQHDPQGKPHHWFDGDGLIHSVHFSHDAQGQLQAVYTRDYVATERFKVESAAGRSVLPKLGGVLEPKAFLGLIARTAWEAIKSGGKVEPMFKPSMGTANTALAFHGNKFLALVENDLPHQVVLPELDTIGPVVYRSKDGSSSWDNHPFTAHPKVCPITGDMMFFGYRMDRKPYLAYGRVTAEGKLDRQLGIDLPYPIMMHDMSITQRHAVFMDLPLNFKPQRAFAGISPLSFDPNDAARIGVLPRDATSGQEIRWFPITPCYVFHTINAYEQDDLVIVEAMRSQSIDLQKVGASSGPDSSDLPFPYRWTLNMSTGEVNEQCMDRDLPCEFPCIRTSLLGVKHRWAYVVNLLVGEELPVLTSVSKLDCTGKRARQTIPFGSGKYGGECVFVPRGDAEEDDGFLVTFVYDSDDDSSCLCIWDAKTMNPEPLASIPMPARVPYGYHGAWVSEEQVQQQQLV